MIQLSEREYEQLLDVLYITDWVFHAHNLFIKQESKSYQELEQKILGLSSQFGMAGLVSWDENNKRYYHSKIFENETPVVEILERFAEKTFWEELALRLAWRDLGQKYGEEKLACMDGEERFKEEQALINKYREEFQNNGLKNVSLSFAD